VKCLKSRAPYRYDTQLEPLQLMHRIFRQQHLPQSEHPKQQHRTPRTSVATSRVRRGGSCSMARSIVSTVVMASSSFDYKYTAFFVSWLTFAITRQGARSVPEIGVDGVVGRRAWHRHRPPSYCGQDGQRTLTPHRFRDRQPVDRRCTHHGL
jgi:hypothetical protein